ncbi:type IV pilus modification PilV family protein [Massilia sp. PWRC2]|uniref:type IV pilus modification PilV family protein n=1 Tax=Massilia sp. PWRC2 TaxID=2804626 RepID=UPI003CF34BFA
MCTSARPLSGGRQHGVTLVELLLFIVIVSIAVAAVLQVMRLNAAASADPLRRKQALMIAEALLEEVQLARYTVCDPASSNAATATSVSACVIAERFGQGGGSGAGQEPVGARPYDNVNDYVAAAGVAQASFNSGGVLADASGVALAVSGYTASLTIVPENLGDIVSGYTAGAIDVGEVLRISVTVSYDSSSLTLDGYRTRYAPTIP